jgi:cytochrome c-type biogenesis protein CcmH
MSLWLVLGAMTVLAAALVAWPLLRPSRQQAGRRDYELRVYRAQLEEVARERERGLLGEREAAAARLEVERRMLAADAATHRAQGGGPRTGARWAIALLIALPLLAGGLYWQLGRPDLPSVPFAGRAEERRLAEGETLQGQLPSVETMILRLEQRVAQSPDDLEAWQRLGQAYELAGRYEDSVRAYRQALALDERSARLHAALGEALVMANGGMVTPAAEQSFERALALDAADPRAGFYRGLALLQAGDRQGAYDAWVALIESSPGDAPWLPELHRRVAALAGDLGLDPADVPVPPTSRADTAPGPTSEQMEDAENMAPEDRAAMIRDMIAGLAARLEEQPGDIEGWRRLGRSYQVLGEPQKAADAYRHVAKALPDDLEAQLDYADALLTAAPDDQLVPAVEQQMRKVLALDPQNPLALFYLGQAAAAAGDTATARTHWQHLLAQVPASAPERAQIQRLLDQLPSGD